MCAFDANPGHNTFICAMPHLCCGVLQCAAVCFSVLQCVAVCCICLLHEGCVHLMPMQVTTYLCVPWLIRVAVCCSVLQCVAVCRSVLQCVAVRGSTTYLCVPLLMCIWHDALVCHDSCVLGITLSCAVTHVCLA